MTVFLAPFGVLRADGLAVQRADLGRPFDVTLVKTDEAFEEVKWVLNFLHACSSLTVTLSMGLMAGVTIRRPAFMSARFFFP